MAEPAPARTMARLPRFVKSEPGASSPASREDHLAFAVFGSRYVISRRAEPLDVAPNPTGDVTRVKNPSAVSRACSPASTAGNKSVGGALSFRHGLAGSPVRLVSSRDPASIRFGDQLIAVLPRLRRFARGLAGSASDADDLVQAACERALARQHQFQEGTRFDSWMFRIVQTIWIDLVRSRDVRKEEGDMPEDHRCRTG
jgi:Sigma-70 region 2